VDEQEKTPNEDNVTGKGDYIEGNLQDKNKNTLVGKDLKQTIDEKNNQQTTNLYISLQDLLRTNEEAKAQIKEGGILSMEVEREFRRIFESLNISMERMSAEVKNLSKEMNANSTLTAASIKVLEQQVQATVALVQSTRAQVEETVAGMRMPAMQHPSKNSTLKNDILAWSQIAISVGIWIGIILYAIDRFT
jgi:hypothetical protein